MKKDLMEILCCPVCKAGLTLKEESVEDDEIVTGTLTCDGCGLVYHIREGIPDLLPKEE